ncbi:MAG: DUF6348 family protein [Oscillospiraceae bacterium]|nr:DUF6348 family protein [Oscillospiraceae bacterium]
MAIFNKKKNIEMKTNPQVDAKNHILEKLNEKVGGTVYDNAILIPRFGYTIDIQVVKNEENNGVYNLQTIFIIRNDYLKDKDEPIIEPIASQGKDFDSALKMLIESFEALIWRPMKMMFDKGKALPISSNYLGQHYDYDLYVNSVVLMGDPERKPAMLIYYIKDVLSSFLGSKKYYWVRIFLARQGTKGTENYKQNIEVRVNGIVCPSLNKRFQPYVDSWKDQDIAVVEKQFAFIVNREEEDLCPFTKEQVVEYTRKTLPLMENCKSAEEAVEMKKQMDEFIGNPALSAEIRIFIPEILAKLTLGYNEGDDLFLLQPNPEGDDAEQKKVPVRFRKTQLRSYYYIQQVLIDYLSRTKPEKEKVQNIVFNSVTFRELRKHIGQPNEKLGRPVEAKDLFIPGTAYNINLDNYKVW